MIKRGTFGKPKPLPGQREYGMKKSEKLENEATAMEDRLQVLRQQMLEERQQIEQKPLKGGSRWRSARADRGSVRNYATDVRDRKPRKSASKSKSSSSRASSNSNNTGTNTRKSTVPVAQTWSVSEVIEWLNSIQLGEYQDLFQENEVDGTTLLEMGLEDLDYLQVKKLSHRKLLLRNIEALKRDGERVPTPSKNQRLPPPPCAVNDDKLREPQSDEMQDNNESDSKVHWSQVKPIRDNEISGDGTPPVNLADGDFNEEESHASFMKALLEWRQCDEEAAAKTSSEANDSGMWSNPLLGGNDDQGGNGGKLLNGEIDEEKEHEEFKRAVEAWRNGERAVTPTIDSGTATNLGHLEEQKKVSCWNCYKVYLSEGGVYDKQTEKVFCTEACLQSFNNQYSKLYKKRAEVAEDS